LSTAGAIIIRRLADGYGSKVPAEVLGQDQSDLNLVRPQLMAGAVAGRLIVGRILSSVGAVATTKAPMVST